MSDDYMLVRVVIIALDPTDWTTLDTPGGAGTLMGCDYAGVVGGVGRDVQRTFSKRDRIAGSGHGGMSFVGFCFAHSPCDDECV